MKKGILFITLAVIILGILFGVISFLKYEPKVAYQFKTQENIPGIRSDSALVQNTSSSMQSNLGISLQELSKHNNQNDCWVVYQNKVYDVTSFLPNHPGGVNTIAGFCGTAGFEQAFIAQHGMSKANLFIKVAIYKGDFANGTA